MKNLFKRNIFYVPDYGTSGANYKPATIYSGQIGKIAQQVIEGMEIPSKFDTFDKPDIEYGEALEVTLFEEATGIEYNKDGISGAIPDPKGHTLIFSSFDEFTFFTKIDYWNIARAMKDSAVAEKESEVIIETLYDADRLRKTGKVYELLNTATAGAPVGTGATQIVNAGQFVEITDKESALSCVTAVALVAAGMRNEPEAFNPYGFKKAARKIVAVIPYQIRVRVKNLLLSQSSNAELVTWGVDEIIEVPASKVNNAIYVVDERYLQLKRRRQRYEEKEIFGSGGNVKVALSVSRMYAACPFFPAAKLTQGVAGAISLSVDAAIAKNTAAAIALNAKRDKALEKAAVIQKTEG